MIEQVTQAIKYRPSLKPATIFLGLGSNLGNRLLHLRQAVKGLTRWLHLKTISPIYQTKPWGLKEQPNFLNMCLKGTTFLTPEALLTSIKSLEKDLGRQSTTHWGPRIIDIDILFYDNLIIKDKHLTIPHPYLTTRAFVLKPLADIAPNLEHPQLNLTIYHLLTQVDQTDIQPLIISPFEDKS